jgi:S1-C subfamily serine protease
VIRNADEIEVGLNDGRSATAEVVGADPDTDLAVLKIDLDKLPTVRFGSSKELAVGDVSLAIGNPFGVGQTVTMGIISATGRSHLGISNLENFIQTDAAINPGNSGGALINAKGELIGINTAIFSKSGASHGIGFAVPSQIAKNVLDAIITDGEVARGWIGVETQDLTVRLVESFGLDKPMGVIVSGIYKNSPAHKSGIRPGDVLVRFNGIEIVDGAIWKSQILQLKPGDKIEIDLVRERKEYQVDLKVAKRPRNAR